MKVVMNKGRAIALCILFLFTSLFGGLLACGGESASGTAEEPKKTGTIKVGVTLYDQYDVFLSEMMADFKADMKAKEEESKITVTVSFYDAASSQSTQDEQVEEMIEDGYDVICVNLVDRTDPTSIIDLAQKNNVNIIFFNRELVEEDLERSNQLYYIGADAVESGKMEGELAAEYLIAHPEADKNGDGLIQYVVLEGEAGHQDAIVRTEYAVSRMEEMDIALEKVTYAICNWNRDQAKAKMSQLIEQEDSIELVLGNNDAMALGAIDAYEAAGIPEESRPAIFGIDGVEEGLDAIEKGNLKASVYNDKAGQAKAMSDLAFALATNNSISNLDLINGKYIRLPYQKITAENVEDYRE